MTCDCMCHTNAFAACTVPGGCGHLHERRCRRADRCTAGEKTPLGRLGAQLNTDDGLCLACTRHVADAITELPRDYVDLEQSLQRGTIGLAELVAATKELPAALRVDIAALASELVRVAVTWAEPVAERLNIDWDSNTMGRHTRPGYALQRAANLLATNMPVLLALRDVEVQTWADNGRYWQYEPSDGITGGLNLLELHHVTRTALGLTKLTHRLPAPCPNCEHVTLVRDNGQDDVHCQHCRCRWTYEDYQRLTLILANDLRRTA